MDSKASFPSKLMCHDSHAVDVTVVKARTQKKYQAVVASVQKLVTSITDTSCTNDKCPRAEFSACVLRMAGHDFMDFSSKGGGSDGCVNFEDPDNAGLKPCLVHGENGQNLNMAYAAHAASVSLADFLAIAGEAVMAQERRTKIMNGQDLGDLFMKQFQWGRKTNHNCANNIHLPIPSESCLANKKTFIDQLGLTWRETAALMGVHTLGRTRLENSGFNGWWSDHNSASHFDNNYYHSLALKGWTPATSAKGKRQWIRSGQLSKRTGKDEMMLNTDMCLLYANHDGTDIKAENDGDKGCCAWIMPDLFAEMGFNKNGATQSANNPEKNKWCGFGSTSGPFGNVKHWCCNMGEISGINKDCNFPAGSSKSSQAKLGPAAKDIMQFAADEDVWIGVFLQAWGKATAKGVL